MESANRIDDKKMGQLFLRNNADVDGLLNVVGDHGLAMTRDAVEYLTRP